MIVFRYLSVILLYWDINKINPLSGDSLTHIFFPRMALTSEIFAVVCIYMYEHVHWQIQDFSEDGASILEGETKYYLTNFPENCMKRNFDPEGWCVLRALSLTFATDVFCLVQ